MICSENRCLWMLWSLGFAIVWLIPFVAVSRLRKPMLILGALIAPTTIFQSFYTVDFWSPPTLFDLAAKYGVDLESLVFTFFSPGLALAAYLSIASKDQKFSLPKRAQWQNLFCLYLAGLTGFFVSYFLFGLNSIYSAHIGMLCGISLGAVITAPHYKSLIITTLGFTALYFLLFKLIDLYEPSYIPSFWKVKNISGNFLWNVPFEEVAFAFLGSAFYCAMTEALFPTRSLNPRALVENIVLARRQAEGRAFARLKGRGYASTL